ncbi:alpha/beta hydrolase [Shewanella canadensis]|uniref:Alpha/beta hydrolase n=1 Tax=Shewanella canadensis TaxID=271096 RepID=A0A431WTS4_9GAMM|nr:alpha/beta hydrolase [Shewanella canadensis]RTR38853.1 alpha/beta hydrolase [Shewanella canadensis]
MTEILQVGDVDVYVEGMGDETIVMVHGWPDTYRVWDKQVEVLKDRYRCVRFTLPGYDKSKPRRAYDLKEIVQLINTIVDTVGNGKPVTLMLHDWGCFFGYQFYMNYREKVTKIIGVDIGDAGSKEHVLSAKVKAFMFGYQMWLAAAWKIGGKLGDAMTRKMAKLLHAPGEAESITSSMTYSYYWKWSHVLTGRSLDHLPLEITCPLLFMYGENKPGMFHSTPWVEKIASDKRNRVEPFQTRHWVMIEAPERFNNIMLDWLGKKD